MSGAYKDVNSLMRGLRVLEVLSRLGWMKVGALAAEAEIDRSSTYRTVSTLVSAGYLVRRSEDGAVSLTSKIMRIADGFRDEDMIAQTIAPFIYELTRTVVWPSDFATFAGGAVTIQVSSHKLSPMSVHRAQIGKHHSLFRSSLGRAILSVMTPTEIETALALATLEAPNARRVWDQHAVEQLVTDVRKAGYASSVGEIEVNISAIALPLRFRNVVGAVNIVFFRSALTPRDAAERYLPSLKKCVRQVEEASNRIPG